MKSTKRNWQKQTSAWRNCIRNPVSKNGKLQKRVRCPAWKRADRTSLVQPAQKSYSQSILSLPRYAIIPWKRGGITEGEVLPWSPIPHAFLNFPLHAVLFQREGGVIEQDILPKFPCIFNLPWLEWNDTSGKVPCDVLSLQNLLFHSSPMEWNIRRGSAEQHTGQGNPRMFWLWSPVLLPPPHKYQGRFRNAWGSWQNIPFYKAPL